MLMQVFFSAAVLLVINYDALPSILPSRQQPGEILRASCAPGKDQLIETSGPWEDSASAAALLGQTVWAYASVSAATLSALGTPMIANSPNAMAHAMGPCEAMRTRGYKSPQANSTSSAGASSL